MAEQIDTFAVDGFQLSLFLSAVGSTNYSKMSELADEPKAQIRATLSAALKTCAEILNAQPLPANVTAGRADQHSRSVQDRMSE